MSELGKDDQANGQEGRCASNCRIDHRQHAISVWPHGPSIEWVCHVRLARRYRVSDVLHLIPSEKIL